MKIGAIIDADILIMVFGTLREDLFPSSERNNCLTCGSVTVDITKGKDNKNFDVSREGPASES